ncbi:MAG: SirB2 family protein [Propionivibrio sp.]
MVNYLLLKYVHISCVVASGCGFFLRGVWMLMDSPRLRQRWVRIFPHIVDTGLLGTAIALATISGQYPIAQSWLTAKVIGLVAYILCGTMALKRGRTKTVRAVFFVVALMIFAYIVLVALNRSPLAILA